MHATAHILTTAVDSTHHLRALKAPRSALLFRLLQTAHPFAASSSRNHGVLVSQLARPPPAAVLLRPYSVQPIQRLVPAAFTDVAYGKDPWINGRATRLNLDVPELTSRDGGKEGADGVEELLLCRTQRRRFCGDVCASLSMVHCGSSQER